MPMPILGIDASRAVTDAPTGTEYYSRALITALLETDSPYFFRLYTRNTPPQGLFPHTHNYEIRAMPFPRLWTHVRLASEMMAHPPQALFVPAHVLPPVHPRNSIVTVHDLGFRLFGDAHPPLQRAYLDASTRWNVGAARYVVADSVATRDDIERFYGTPPAKIHVVYPSFNRNIFTPNRDASERARVRAKYALPERYVISVGTLHPRKNYGRLVEAFAAVSSEYSLVIVGKKGWRAEQVAAAVERLNMGGRVRFLDYAPMEDLPVLYAGAQLAVFPSLYEGFGIPALEAQACETPLVASRLSSLPEVAGEGAIYFDPLSVPEMTRAMLAVLKDTTLQQNLVARGRENVRRFTWERAAREILHMLIDNESQIPNPS